MNSKNWNGSYLEKDVIISTAVRMHSILSSCAGGGLHELIITIKRCNIELGFQRFTDENVMNGGRLYISDGYCKTSDIVRCIKSMYNRDIKNCSFSELLSAYQIETVCSNEALRNQLTMAYKRISITPRGLSNDKKTKPSYCYILRLQNQKYYVGSAYEPTKRYAEHLKGKGSKWTQIFRPTEKIKQIKCASLGESLITEDALTLWMMVKFGKDNVRGGRWLQERIKHIPELNEARKIVALHRSDTQKTKGELMVLVLKSGIKYSWYWRDILEKHPSIKEGQFFINILKKCSV